MCAFVGMRWEIEVFHFYWFLRGVADEVSFLAGVSHCRVLSVMKLASLHFHF